MKTILILLVAFTAACTHTPTQNSTPVPPGPDDSAQLKQVIHTFAEAAKRVDAFNAAYFGVEENLSQFGDYPSPQYFARSQQIYQRALSDLKSIHFDRLPANDQFTYRLFKEDMETSLQSFDFPQELLDFNQMSNRLHSYMDDSSPTLTSFPFDSLVHYDAFVKRSEGFPAYVDHQIEALKRGVRQGVTLNCETARQTPNSYRAALTEDVEKNPFWRPILFMPKQIEERERVVSAFRTMIQERIVPGYKKFDKFFHDQYLPHCRKQFGIGRLPKGEKWYAYEIRRKTNLSLSAREIHRIGLAEVARISAEMEKVRTQLGYKGTLKSMLADLAHDPKRFFHSSEEMFNAFAKVKAQVQTQVPKLFSRIPKTDYKIVESSNSEDAAGSYNSPTDLLPYGRFIVNTHNLHSVADWGINTLSLHETVPGHHFQLALQFEMKDQLSEYQRKLYESNAFVEGWALYAESLGYEMGVYDDPLQRLGNLNGEMLRAVRLVVDTGIHFYGWSHDKALRYMVDHLGDDPKDLEIETNRYSVWPGQALGYKMGQLKIKELRQLAEKTLGPKFDIREFHNVVIGGGTLSLSLLEERVKEWIKTVH